MSIGIYAFLRIYFFGFGLSAFAQFRTHCPPSSVPPPVRSARRGLSGIECSPVQRVQRPGVCACARSAAGMVCLASGTACAAACSVQSPRVCWGCGLHRRGMQGAPGVGWVMPAIKFFKEKGVFGVPLTNTHPSFTKRHPSDCASLQKFLKIQKDPFRSLDCAIIS
jgi:hypothetical protein